MRHFLAGGSGFIGSHLARSLIERGEEVIVFDNLASGAEWYLDDIKGDPRLKLVVADLQDIEAVVEHSKGCRQAFHLAANPDIAKAETEPSVDFWQGTYLTNNVIEACRINGIGRITYTSGSGVYGDQGDEAVDEAFGPLEPVSTYGASKLGCEAMLSAYSHMFGINATCFRFANVVGPRQTHGVVYDFVRQLLVNPKRLRILGDGKQSKSYIHVTDAVAAMLIVADADQPGFDVFNASTEDYTSVRDIADLVVEGMGLTDVEYEFTGGSRGWKGDVPVVRFNSDKIRRIGWSNRYTSVEALRDSIRANIGEAQRETSAR